MATYSIKAIKYCEQSAPGPEMYYMSHWDEWIDVDFYVFLLRRDDGQVCLVDTGVRDVEEINPHVIAGVGQRGRFRMDMVTQNIPLLLRQEGIDPAQVEYVFLTHLHYDHCSNVQLFPNANFVVSRKGWIQTLSCDHPQMLPHPVFPRDVIGYLAGEARDRLILADDGEVIPGISVFYTGGHTLCGQAVKVNTGEGAVVLTGDVVFLYGNLEQDHPVGLAVNIPECYAAMARIRREADIVVPAHDPEILRRYPDGVIVA
ncbi:MAG TPA: N-acyl homoserine lactonase family protein [Anaerolineae bacterium]|nr:N-acyl homoserine lactonase family protein [Anaerolineae bacterium]